MQYRSCSGEGWRDTVRHAQVVAPVPTSTTNIIDRNAVNHNGPAANGWASKAIGKRAAHPANVVEGFTMAESSYPTDSRNRMRTSTNGRESRADYPRQQHSCASKEIHERNVSGSQWQRQK